MNSSILKKIKELNSTTYVNIKELSITYSNSKALNSTQCFFDAIACAQLLSRVKATSESVVRVHYFKICMITAFIIFKAGLNNAALNF